MEHIKYYLGDHTREDEVGRHVEHMVNKKCIQYSDWKT
jgi:hypothetical protein